MEQWHLELSDNSQVQQSEFEVHRVIAQYKSEIQAEIDQLASDIQTVLHAPKTVLDAPNRVGLTQGMQSAKNIAEARKNFIDSVFSALRPDKFPPEKKFHESVWQISVLLQFFGKSRDCDNRPIVTAINNYFENGKSSVAQRRILNLILLPHMMRPVRTSVIDSDGGVGYIQPSSHELIECLNLEIHQLASLAIKDLKSCWPTKQALIESSVKFMADSDQESKEIVKEMMRNSMPKPLEIQEF